MTRKQNSPKQAPEKAAPAKKGPPKKGPKKKKNKQAAPGNGILVRVSIAMVLVLAAAGGLAYLANHYAPPPPPKAKPALAKQAPKTAAPAKPAAKKAPPHPKLVYEVFPEERHPEPPDDAAETPIPMPPPSGKPRVAIIIDDMGYGNGASMRFLDMPYPLTFSVLPHSPEQEEVANTAHARGREVLLHLPMEPMEYPRVDPGPGTLLASMPTDTLIDILTENLAAVPHVAGVNNHMGSRLTMESGAMYPIFTILKKQGLFFVDSRTTQHSICKPSARLFQLPFAQRDVFLDHVRTTAFVEKQVKALMARARKKGQAIGIGHPYQETYQVLLARLPEISREVDLVPVSALVRVAN